LGKNNKKAPNPGLGCLSAGSETRKETGWPTEDPHSDNGERGKKNATNRLKKKGRVARGNKTRNGDNGLEFVKSKNRDQREKRVKEAKKQGRRKGGAEGGRGKHKVSTEVAGGGKQN